MNQPASRLPELISLAHEGSSEKRRLLLRELTDSFFTTTAHSESEQALYGTVMARLAEEMEAEVRAQLSVRFSRAPNAPRELIRKMAHDEAMIAAPVLQHSMVLTDEDLLGVVEKHGQEHMRAVSKRSTVSEAVSDVIVRRGDDGTLGVLLRNDGAQLSRQASETAIERAKVNPKLHEAAVERAALPADLRNEMYFVVEARLRQRILEQNAQIDPALLENALANAHNRMAGEDGSLPADYAEARTEVEHLIATNDLVPPTLARLLRSGRRTSFLIALSHLSDIDFGTAQQIIENGQLDALAVICKAADLDRALFLTFAMVLLDGEGNAVARAHDYAAYYTELTTDAAQRTLRFWRMRRGVQAAA